MKFAFRVTIEVEDTTGQADKDGIYQGYKPTREDAEDYIAEAVQGWGGGRHPTDPFFDIHRVYVRGVARA